MPISRFFVLLSACFLSLSLFYVHASLNVYEFNDAKKEAEFSVLIDELRCPKCQNNNLADSNAPLARDIKNYVYDAVQKGTDKAEVVDFLASKYGDFITYKPRFSGRALWVWLLPFMVLLIAIGFIVMRFKNTKAQAESETLPSMENLIKDYEAQSSTEQSKERQS